MCAPVGGLARANGVQETWLHLGFAFLTTFPTSSVPCTCFFTFYVITGSLLRTAPLSKTPNLVQLLYGHLCGSICSKTAKMKLCRGQKLLPMQPLFVTLTSCHFGAQAFCRNVSWKLESWGVLWSLCWCRNLTGRDHTLKQSCNLGEGFLMFLFTHCAAHYILMIFFVSQFDQWLAWAAGGLEFRSCGTEECSICQGVASLCLCQISTECADYRVMSNNASNCIILMVLYLINCTRSLSVHI